MSKVICDLCGTSYPETASQCPICGSVRQSDALISDEHEKDGGGYTHIKGGRFSKSNVRKRNKGAAAPANQKEKSSNNKAIGLIIVLSALIVIVALLIAFIAIGWRNQSGTQPSDGVTTTEPENVPCESINLLQIDIKLTEVGEIWYLEAIPSPANTTDAVVYASSDENVVSVSQDGKVTCVGAGQASITVSCGEQTAECRISCEVAQTETTYPVDALRLNRSSITADSEGYSWILYSGEIPAELITWTSDNEAVATIANGEVTAVSEGETTVYGEYNGKKVSCKIVCDFGENTGSGGITEDGNGGNTDSTEGSRPSDGSGIKLYSQFGNALSYADYMGAYDVTISIGESVGLYLKDASGNELDVTWKIIEGDSCTISDNYVKANSSESNCMVACEYNGVTYKCYIRTVN